MDGIMGIFQSISSANPSDLNIYIKALNEHQSFRCNVTGTTNPAVQHITALISKPATRYEGLLILQSLLQQCSLDIIDQRGVLWVTLCIKACNPKGGESTISLAFDALKILLQKSSELPELSKSFSSNQIGKICETFINVHPAAQLSALKCLETCLKIYPGPCGGNSKTLIQRFLSNFIDSDNENLVIWAAKCMHLLQQVRGGGVQGLNHKTAWQNYQQKILGSLHHVLDSLYTNCLEICDDDSINEHLGINPLDLTNEPVQRASQLFIRFKNLLTFLIIAIRDPFPVSKAFMPKKILNLIYRGLSVNCSMLEKNLISDNIAIGALLPDLHIELFKLAETLILTLKSHLSMYYENILNFAIETLKWTSSGKSDGFRKPYGNLRVAAYNMLTLWCKTMKYASGCESIYENIIDQILNDITPFQNEITLKVLCGAKKYMSKKARRQLYKVQNEKSHLAQMHSKILEPCNTKVVYSDQDNQSIAVAALDCLNQIILCSSCFLKPMFLKELQDKIILICLQCNELCSIKEKWKLYSNYLCRQSIYNMLTTIVLSPHHLCPPPTQLAIHLLLLAQTNDSHPIVRNTCRNNIITLEKLLHPQKESLYFPPDYKTLRNISTDSCLNSNLINGNKEDSLNSYDSDNEYEIEQNELEQNDLEQNEHSLNHSDANLEKINFDIEEQNIEKVAVELVKPTKTDALEICESNITSPKRKLQINLDNEKSLNKINSLDDPVPKKIRLGEDMDTVVVENEVVTTDKCNVGKNKLKGNDEFLILEENCSELDDEEIVNQISAEFVNELYEIY